MKPWKNDVAVLLIFFVRDDVFSQTFEAVRQARPRKLLLWQDGARSNRPDDIEGIERCRKIVENIDWDCEVHRNYQTRNWGCDPSTFYSHKWAFSIVDKCIVLEDDCVPSQSFFPFCKELLDKYENDTRINRICGFNSYSQGPCQSDYFFSNSGSVWGWATWKRVADTWDEFYSFLDDSFLMRQLALKYNTTEYKNDLRKCLRHASIGMPYWESINTFARLINNQVNIISSVSQITNVGFTQNATHGTELSLLSDSARGILLTQGSDILFPIKHPSCFIENIEYQKILSKKSSFFSKTQSVIRRLCKGQYKNAFTAVMRFFNIKKDTL